MKKLFSLSFALLAVGSMQGGKFGSCSLDIEKYSDEARANLYSDNRTAIQRAIRSLNPEELQKALEEGQNIVKKDFTFYSKTLDTLSEDQKLEKIAQLKTDALTQKEGYIRNLEVVEKNVPNLDKTKIVVANQVRASIWKGILGSTKLATALGLGYIAMNPDSISYGDFSLPEGKLPIYGLFGLGTVVGVLGGNSIKNAVFQYFAAGKRLKSDQKIKELADKNLKNMKTTLKKFNFFDSCDKDTLKKAQEFAQNQSKAQEELLQAKIGLIKLEADYYKKKLDGKETKEEKELREAKTNYYQKTSGWYYSPNDEVQENQDQGYEMESMDASQEGNSKEEEKEIEEINK